MSRIFACFSLILLSFAALACSGEPSPANGVSGGTPTPIPAPTPISVSAEALQSEKELNEVAWKNKYNDNIALITGTIDSITEAGNKYDVKLETGIFTVDVVCKVDKADESTVLSLQQGQTVNVLGRVTDDGILDIVVKDCSIASSGGAPQPAGQVQTAAPTTPAATPAPTATTAAATASPTTTLAPTATPTPIATATPAPTVPPTATPTPTPVPLGMTLDNPQSAGEVLQGTDGTEIVVTGILENATDLVIETNRFNDPPEPGNRFYMVTVAVSYVSGSDSLDVAEADYSLVGDKKVIYTPFEESCGVIPDELAAELFPGGQAEGNVCFQIEADDGNFVLIYEPFLSFEGERRFLSLDPMMVSSAERLTAAFPTPSTVSI